MNKHQRDALTRIREETDYEDDRVGDANNYVLRGALGTGVGEATLRYLLSHGLIEAGTNRFFNKIGYRITELGRAALKEEAIPTPKSSKPRLKPLPNRLGTPRSRFD